MRNQALIIELGKIVAVVALATAGIGCGGAPPKHVVPADNEVVPYQAPDVEELAGTEDEEDAEEPDEADAGPAQNPQQ